MTHQSYEILITTPGDKPITKEEMKAAVERMPELQEGSKVRVTEMWPGALK